MSVEASFFVVIGQKFNDHGTWVGRTSARLTINKPALEKHEVAMKFELNLPNSLFQKPALHARVVIPDTGSPLDISAQVQEAIAAAVKEQTGIVLHISAPEAT